MVPKRFFSLIGVALLATVFVGGITYQITKNPESESVAKLRDARGAVIGTAQFTEHHNGILVKIQTQGLESGSHPLHIHETGRCEPPNFESAGAHFDPPGAMQKTASQHHTTGHSHGSSQAAGDLPDLKVGADGEADYETVNHHLAISGDRTAILDADGSAIVIHETRKSSAGNHGEQRIACGVIEKT